MEKREYKNGRGFSGSSLRRWGEDYRNPEKDKCMLRAMLHNKMIKCWIVEASKRVELKVHALFKAKYSPFNVCAGIAVSMLQFALTWLTQSRHLQNFKTFLCYVIKLRRSRTLLHDLPWRVATTFHLVLTLLFFFKKGIAIHQTDTGEFSDKAVSMPHFALTQFFWNHQNFATSFYMIPLSRSCWRYQKIWNEEQHPLSDTVPILFKNKKFWHCHASNR